MFKKITAAIAIALGLLTVPSYASSVKDIMDATYKLYYGDRAICSGQFVQSSEGGQDLFLTAAHCVAQSGTYSVKKRVLDSDYELIREETFILKPVRTLAKKDVALYETKDRSSVFPTVDLADMADKGELVVGDSVIAVGYPLTLEISVTKGEFVGEVKLPGINTFDHPFYRSNVNVAPGSSGGGLYSEFGDGDWRLIGTTFGGFGIPGGFINYFTTMDFVHEVTRNLVYTHDTKIEEDLGDGPEK